MWESELPKIASSSVYILRVSSSFFLRLQKYVQQQQVSLNQIPFRLLLLPWIQEHVKFSEPLKSGVYISHHSLGLLKENPTCFQSQTLWGLLFPVQDPQAREPYV